MVGKNTEGASGYLRATSRGGSQLTAPAAQLAESAQEAAATEIKASAAAVRRAIAQIRRRRDTADASAKRQQCLRHSDSSALAVAGGAAIPPDSLEPCPTGLRLVRFGADPLSSVTGRL